MNGQPSPVALNVNTKKSNIIQKDKNQSISLEKLEKNNERRQMNKTMNKSQINHLLCKNNQLRDQSPKNVPKTYRERIRDGELSSQTSSSEGAKQLYNSQLSNGELSNCTEERNFTPGQPQFKTFLKQQTAERRKVKVKMKSKQRKNKQLALQFQNTSKRSHTRQVESKQEKLSKAINPQQQRKRGHIKQNSYIGSNRMSPTPQPNRIEYLSQTYSANESSQQQKSRTHGLRSLEGKDSANLSNYNISPERGQNLSGVFEQLNKKFQKTLEIQFNSQERTSELDSMILSPFAMNNKAQIQEFSTNQKNFSKIGDSKNEPVQSAHYLYLENKNKGRNDDHKEAKIKALDIEDRTHLSKEISSNKNIQSTIQTQSLNSIQQQLIQMGSNQSALDDLIPNSENVKQNHMPSKLLYLSQLPVSGTAGKQDLAPVGLAQEDIDNTDVESINNTNSNTDIIKHLEAMNGNISEEQHRMKILQQQIIKGKQMQQQQRVMEKKRPRHCHKSHENRISEDEGNAEEVEELKRQTEAQQPLRANRAKEAANFQEKELILIEDEAALKNGFRYDAAEPVNQAVNNGKGKQKETPLQSHSGSKSCNKIRENEEAFKGKRFSNQQNTNIINSTSQIQTTKYFNQGSKGDQYQPNNRPNFQIKTPEISTILKNNTRQSLGSGTIESFRGNKPLGLAQVQGQQMHNTPSVGSTNISNLTNQKAIKPIVTKRRETRIKSLYATTTNDQDLTLDLSKINQELNKISIKPTNDQLSSNSARKAPANRSHLMMKRSSVEGSKIEKLKTQNKLVSKKSIKENPPFDSRRKMTLNSMQALRVVGGRSLERSQDRRAPTLAMIEKMEKMEHKHSVSSDKQKQGRSITTQIFDKMADIASYALAANLNPQQSPSNLRQRSTKDQNSNNKIQDIKKSSSKLTMAAQLQKYRADGVSAPAAGKSVFSGGTNCYSPKFHKPQRMQVPPPNQGGPPVLNTSLINKQNNYLVSASSGSGQFIQHPRTTKANQSNGAAGDHANIIVTISPPDSQRSTQRNNRIGSGIQHIQTMKHANLRSKTTSMGPGPYNFQMPKSARGMNQREHKSKREPQHFNFRNVLGIDNENLNYSENQLDGDSALSSQDDRQENIRSSQQDLLVKSNLGQNNKINPSCFMHQFPSKSNHQRVSFMERISEQLEENPVDGQTSYKSPHSGMQPPNDNSVQSSIVSHDINQSGSRTQKRRQRNNHHQSQQQQLTHVLDFNQKGNQGSNSKNIELGYQNNQNHRDHNKGRNDLEIKMQETLPAMTNGLKPGSKNTAATIRGTSPQESTPMVATINNRHNSILSIQPIGHVEDVEPMEEALNAIFPPSEQEQEKKILENLPFNGCTCNRDLGILTEGVHQKKGCANTSKWLQMAYKEENYLYLSSYKLYQGFLTLSRNKNKSEQESQIEQDILQDLERTFQHLEYFQRPVVQQSLMRILIAFSNYETNVGYVQGMNFIAAALIVHTGEVAAFWLLCALMEKYKLKKVLSHGLTGLYYHEEQIEILGRQHLPKLFEHFDRTFVSVCLFSTDWIISMFLNFIPIEFTHIYLDLFFEKSWQVFYEVALSLLKYYENDLLRLRDAGQIVGQIKQARLGCEHLYILSSQQSLQSSRYKANYDPSRASAPQDLQKITEMSDSDFNPRQSDISGTPFSVINLIQQNNDHIIQPIAVEELKDTSILEDSRSDIMTEKNNKPTRSQSMLPQNNKKVKLVLNETDSILSLQMAQSYMQNPLFVKNVKMWKQIIESLKQ